MQDIHILDFDGSITAQKDFISRFQNRIKIRNLRKHRHTARLWTSPRKFAQICHTEFSALTGGFSLMGSGDFHHFTLGLVARYIEPLTVVLFDNHPDWIRPPHKYHCGTWVYSLARLPQVARIIIVGLESGDIEGKQFLNGDVESFHSHRIILIPYRPVRAEIAKNDYVELVSQLGDDLDRGIAEILGYINTPYVYISVDKDCLRTEDAYTNWEQGTMPLDVVTKTIAAIRTKFEIIGADSVGDYSPPKFRSPIKWLGSWLDRKIHKTPSGRAQLKSNELANIAILKALDGSL